MFGSSLAYSAENKGYFCCSKLQNVIRANLKTLRFDQPQSKIAITTRHISRVGYKIKKQNDRSHLGYQRTHLYVIFTSWLAFFIPTNKHVNMYHIIFKYLLLSLNHSPTLEIRKYKAVVLTSAEEYISSLNTTPTCLEKYIQFSVDKLFDEICI